MTRAARTYGERTAHRDEQNACPDCGARYTGTGYYCPDCAADRVLRGLAERDALIGRSL